jgi:hypothetical protein
VREDFLDSLHVIDVMPGHHTHNLFDRLVPALGMHSELRLVGVTPSQYRHRTSLPSLLPR